MRLKIEFFAWNAEKLTNLGSDTCHLPSSYYPLRPNISSLSEIGFGAASSPLMSIFFDMQRIARFDSVAVILKSKQFPDFQSDGLVKKYVEQARSQQHTS